jgi:16S rRNA (cytosine1402-N4)-methyltransferase
VLPEPTPTHPVHRPVLVPEVVDWLAPVARREGAVLVDGTVGAGGHAVPLAGGLGPGGRLIGLDRDPEMLALAERTTHGLPVTLIKASYSDMGEVLDGLGIDAVDGIVLDLGLSSDQLAWTHRGFSFAADGPLDMRFDPDGPTTAAEVVNTWSEEELARLFFEYGEERHSRRVARRVVEARRIEPIATTGRLAEIVRRSIPGKWGPIDPATRVFQALRIAVNAELDHLDLALERMADWLRPGGRAAVISFHSLEDRRVKVAFRDDLRLAVLTRKPVVATTEEVAVNPRARSAKLRVAERCPDLVGPPVPPNLRSPDRLRRFGH